MIKISEVTQNLIEEDEVALYALSQGWLNLSSYAEHLLKEVEEKTKKPIRKNSIVAALSRLSENLAKQKPLLPKVVLESISAKLGLIELAYNKTPENQKRAATLYTDKKFTESGFYTITQGVSEISIITSQEAKQNILKHFKGEKPKFSFEGLSALTVSFDPKYIFIPNATFVLVRVLAIRSINIIEIVSTYTEHTFILEEKDLQRTFEFMSRLMKKPTKL